MHVFGQSNSYYLGTNVMSSPVRPKADGQSSQAAFEQQINYRDPNAALFQSLLKEPSVQDNITLSEDGTYSFSHDKGSVLNRHEKLAQLLISEQNGYRPADPGQQTPFSASDLTKFKQMTGYNLFQAGGMYTVVDDDGNAPAASDQAMVMAAWNAFDLAKGVQDLENKGADLSVGNLREAIQGLRNQQGADTSLFDSLIAMLGRLPGK